MECETTSTYRYITKHAESLLIYKNDKNRETYFFNKQFVTTTYNYYTGGLQKKRTYWEVGIIRSSELLRRKILKYIPMRKYRTNLLRKHQH